MEVRIKELETLLEPQEPDPSTFNQWEHAR